MSFNVPGGLLNTDGIPLTVAPGPDWLNIVLGVAAALVLVVLTAILVRGNEQGKRRGRRRAPRGGALGVARQLWALAGRQGLA